MALLAPHALQVGSRLGVYELTRFLGEGGFAEVWLARRAADASQEVAIKLVRRGRVSTVAERTMFLDEANIAAAIRHPNVARVYEIGDEEGLSYLVMEHVAGGSLETIALGASALGEPVPIAIAVTLAAETCAGIHAAHELVIDGRPQHVVHRDISPQNILITEEGVPKVIDFGIAKARERISKQTSTGIAKGKIAYMSPEQARGVDIDRRADIWAIGMVLFELLEGRKALNGPNEIARLQALVSRPLRLTFSRTPDRIARIVRRALSFKASDRQETADEVRIALEEALVAEGLATSAAEIRAFCIRARAAAEMADAQGQSHRELEALLGGGAAAETVSRIAPSPSARGKSRRAAIGALVAVVLLVVGGIGVRVATRPSKEAELAPSPSAASIVPIASIASIAPSIEPVDSGASSAAPVEVASSASALRSSTPPHAHAAHAPPKATTPNSTPNTAKGKPARHPPGYAEIE